MPEPNFANRTIWTGDNLDILRGLNSETADLIYLDPPFNSNKDYAAPVGSEAAGAAFKDTWHLSDLDVAWAGLIADEQPAISYLLDAAGRTHGKGMQSYLTMMAVRLLEMRRVLKSTGSTYLHCDPTASHYLKLLMDAIYGRANFRNEIVWAYRTGGNSKSSFAKKHDVLLFYSRSPRYTFNQQKEKAYTKSKSRKPGVHNYGAGMAEFMQDEGGVYNLVNMRDVWEIPYINSQAAERVGYPTQKPLALLERIIAASSNPGDVVLDPFCGCATACVAADRLERQWVGIDISPKAADLVNVRLQDAMGSLFHHGFVTARTDVPQRTDVAAPKNYRESKHVLYGQQEGRCGGCATLFEFRHFEVDHVVPQSRGGTDHLGNLQLLCGHCNRVKGDRPQEYLVARLAEMAR